MAKRAPGLFLVAPDKADYACVINTCRVLILYAIVAMFDTIL